MVRRSVHVDQLSLVEVKPPPGRRRRVPYVHVHTPEELAAFARSIANSMRIRGDELGPDEKWCPGGCGKRIHRDRRHCGRRWCDAVRPSWAASFRAVIHSALNAYCELYGSEAKVLQGVLTCTAEAWWWDTSKCTHPPDVACSGPLGCRVLDSVADDQRRLWSARRHETLNAARTAAIRQLRREGWDNERMPTLLLWVMEDQSRGVPHLHFVLGHTTKLEKAFARAFFRELSRRRTPTALGTRRRTRRRFSNRASTRPGGSATTCRSLPGTSRRAKVRQRSCFGIRASGSSTSRRGSVVCRASP